MGEALTLPPLNLYTCLRCAYLLLPDSCLRTRPSSYQKTGLSGFPRTNEVTFTGLILTLSPRPAPGSLCSSFTGHFSLPQAQRACSRLRDLEPTLVLNFCTQVWRLIFPAPARTPSLTSPLKGQPLPPPSHPPCVSSPAVALPACVLLV